MLMEGSRTWQASRLEVGYSRLEVYNWTMPTQMFTIPPTMLQLLGKLRNDPKYHC